MDHTRYLIVGGGISGLAFADWLGPSEDYHLLEAEPEVGGYCRTVQRDGYIWDYSGHFFHFREPDIERYLVERMNSPVLRVKRDSRVWYADRLIDFPFQENIHQLPEAEYEECVRELRQRPAKGEANFREMLFARYGRGIAEKFLVPYNEKLFATDLELLDAEAAGRFFPHATVDEILRNAQERRKAGYNVTFTYPAGGAAQYTRALAQGVDANRISLNERVLCIDLAKKVAVTDKRSIGYEFLVSTAPFIALLRMCAIEHEPGLYGYSKVQVFNLGFDRKGLRGVHWIYFPQRDLSFYRVGFYDNIFNSERMSLYVEIGLARNADTTAYANVERVLDDLRRCGVLTDQRLVASHEVVLDPAYVHISGRTNRDVAEKKRALIEHDVHSLGRYGSWTYCSIEDNIVEARALADALKG